MQFIKTLGKIVKVQFTKAEQKALDTEINRQLEEHTRKHNLEIEAMFLWYLHEKLGFGHKRLKEAFMDNVRMVDELCKRYLMENDGDDAWLCTRELKKYGVDLEEWYKERRGEK